MTLRLSGRKGKQREEKAKASSERSQPPHLAAGCYSLEELHLRAFSKPEVCLLFRSLSLRVLAGFGGQPMVVSLYAISS